MNKHMERRIEDSDNTVDYQNLHEDCLIPQKPSKKMHGSGSGSGSGSGGTIFRAHHGVATGLNIQLLSLTTFQVCFCFIYKYMHFIH